MTGFLYSILLPLITSFILINILWPNNFIYKNPVLFRIFKVFLSIGFAFGISSSISFVWLVSFGPSVKGLAIIETALALVLSLILFYKIKMKGSSASSEYNHNEIRNPKSDLALPFAFFSIFALSFTIFILHSLKNPHGGWDAWAIWNMRARLLFRSSDQWKNALFGRFGFPHPDYPLLIPSFISRCWKYLNKETTLVPVLLSMLFTFSTVGLLFSIIAISRTKNQGYLAALVLIGTSFFIKEGAAQCADVPISFYFLASILLFFLYDWTEGNNKNFLILAGLAVGFAGWTKNEGLLFIVSIIAARFILCVSKKGAKKFLNEMAFFLMGFLPILIIIIYFKFRLVPPNDWISLKLLTIEGSLTIISRLKDISRYFVILRVFLFRNRIINILPLLIIYLALVGIRTEKKYRENLTFPVLILSFMIIGYFLVYLITPVDLYWHLITSSNRLFLQLWPSLLFIYFLIVNSNSYLYS